MKLSQLKALIKEVIKEELTTRAELDKGVMATTNIPEGKEEEDEQSSSGAAGGFQTPFAFKKKTNEALGHNPAYVYKYKVKGMEHRFNTPKSAVRWLRNFEPEFRRGQYEDDYLLSKYFIYDDGKQPWDDRQIQEMTSTGAVAGYQTPFAFSKNKSGSKRAVDATKKLGYKVIGPAPRV